ncbi:peroxiredoxin [Synoicihabitans lomoniglobus]|uniref:thioredoxin-dependent peroxiredoxin n=1 Tax=Synoicihabitans lomoniglobus TaxID=2909285 RepID=A0AAE9ZVI6_9BACT|nr:peroxiredoxin [Opitutaceae bacterium LMO-M01]WED64857.1 peroxiredoxin [Opitutaceae bacterium LMO-M01]
MKHRNLALFALFFAMLNFGSAAQLEVGATAPTLTATTDTGASIDLAEVYAGHAYTLVYFYPKADTPGCTKQGCSLRDSYEDLTAQGVAVIGVSYDTVENQSAFKDKYQLPFTLIADTDKSVAKAFGSNGMMMASRSAFLVHEGKVVYADHKGSTTEQANDILGFLAK